MQEPQPTASVTMYTNGPGVVNNRSAATDFENNVTALAGGAATYTTRLAHAYIVLGSVSVGSALSGGGGGGGGLSNGAIAGIVVGAVVGALVLLCLLCLICFLCGYRPLGSRDVSEPSSAEASRKDERPMPIAAAGAGLAGAATTAPDLSGEESEYRAYHTPPLVDREVAEVSDVDPDQSSQLHIHV